MTAFNAPDGSFRYVCMPMGLKTASAVFCRYLDTALGSLKWDSCLCYIDDVIVFGKTFDEHFEALSKIMARLELKGPTMGAIEEVSHRGGGGPVLGSQGYPGRRAAGE